MPHNSLADSVLVTLDIAGTIASANTNGTAMDMQGWDGCLYVFNIGTMVNGATFDARIVQSTALNMAGATNITNALLVQVANTSNANTFMIDVFRPTNRYIRSATQPATANSTFTSVAIRYRRGGILGALTQTAAQTVRVTVN